MNWKMWRIMVFLLAIAGLGRAGAGTLHFEVVTARGQAAAANASEAFIFIRISNADGTSNDGIRLETRQDPRRVDWSLKDPHGVSPLCWCHQGTKAECRLRSETLSEI